jgi:hypothetical protein
MTEIITSGKAKSFAECLAFIETTLTNMGYELIHYNEEDGTLSLSGYDSVGNYCEYQSLSVFTISQAVAHVQRYKTVRDSIFAIHLASSTKEYHEKLEALSDQDRATFLKGVEDLYTQAEEFAANFTAPLMLEAGDITEDTDSQE